MTNLLFLQVRRTHGRGMGERIVTKFIWTTITSSYTDDEHVDSTDSRV